MLPIRAVFLFAVLSLGAQGSSVLRREDLDVTEGAIGQGADGMLTVDVAKMRAVATIPTGDNVELRVRDRGPVANAQALGSGEMRRQIALKLRAQDPCNLLYVSWRASRGDRWTERVGRVGWRCGDHASRADRDSE